MQDDELTQYEKEQLEELSGAKTTQLSDLIDEFNMNRNEEGDFSVHAQKKKAK
jgi:hypothetical protein